MALPRLAFTCSVGPTIGKEEGSFLKKKKKKKTQPTFFSALTALLGSNCSSFWMFDFYFLRFTTKAKWSKAFAAIFFVLLLPPNCKCSICSD